MGSILLFLNSSLGRMAAMGIALALVLASCGVQTARLKHTKAELQKARAELYVQGADGRPSQLTWQKRASDDERDLLTCHQNVTTQALAISAQNSAVDALKAEADRKGAQVAAALQTARKSVLAAQSEADRISRIHVTGSDTCQRLLDAERQITESPK